MTHDTNSSSTDPADWSTRIISAAQFLLSVSRRGISEFRKDRTGQIAAALTYHTLFSLLPLMALALVILRTFVGPAEQVAFKDFVVDSAIEWLVVEDNGPIIDETDPGLGGTAEPSDAGLSEFNATISRIDETVMGLLNQLQNIDFQSIGVIGVLLFLYAATGLLVTIEQSFNQIYGVNAGRRWHYRLPLYYTTVTLAPLAIIAGQVLQQNAARTMAGYSWTEWLAVPISIAYPLLTTWAVFYLMYLLIPNARVNLRSAGIGSALAAVASVALLELFSIYTSSYLGKNLYGSLALLPLTMLWIWLNWLIILFGLQVSYIIQTGLSGKEHGAVKRSLGAVEMCDPRWMLVILSAVAERFKRGETATTGDIALRLRTTEATVETLAEHLAEQGFLHRIDEGGSAGEVVHYTLARPPEDIRVSDLFELWPGSSLQTGEASDLPGSDLIARLDSDCADAISGLRIDVSHPAENGASSTS